MELRIPQSKYKVITILTKSKTLNTNSHIDDCIYIFNNLNFVRLFLWKLAQKLYLWCQKRHLTEEQKGLLPNRHWVKV